MNGGGDPARFHLRLSHLGLHSDAAERRQEQRGENANDADDHQQFDQREGRAKRGVRNAECGVRICVSGGDCQCGFS